MEKNEILAPQATCMTWRLMRAAWTIWSAISQRPMRVWEWFWASLALQFASNVHRLVGERNSMMFWPLKIFALTRTMTEMGCECWNRPRLCVQELYYFLKTFKDHDSLRSEKYAACMYLTAGVCFKVQQYLTNRSSRQLLLGEMCPSPCCQDVEPKTSLRI